MNFRRALPTALVAVALVLSGCGGDDEATGTTTATTTTAAADAASGTTANTTDATSGTTVASGGAEESGSLNEAFAARLMEQRLTEDPDEAACAADSIIATMGEERLAELGMTADNIGLMSDYAFTQAEQTSMLGQLFDCIDISVSLRQEYVDSGLTEEQAVCVVEQLDVDALKELASSGPEGGDAAVAAQAEAEVGAFAECGVER